MTIQQKKDLLYSNEKFVLFDEHSGVRRERHNDERYYSIVDIVAILTGSDRARKYWNDLKTKLHQEGFFEMSEKIGQLKFIASDGKRYLSDAGNTETVLRIIQSIPSPKAEPLKKRLASLGNEKFQEMNDPELGMLRARERAVIAYRAKGRTEEQIQARMQSIETRNTYTDEFKKRGIESKEYGILTNIGYGWTGMNAKELKDFKGLGKNHNIRDNMSLHEILLTQLQEETSRKLMVNKDAQRFNEVSQCVEKGAEVAKKTKEHIEEVTGESVITSENNLTAAQKKGISKKTNI